MTDDRSDETGAFLRARIAEIEASVDVPDVRSVTERSVRRERRRRFRTIVVVAAAVVLVTGLIVGLHPTRSANTTSAAELTAFKVGKEALAEKGGPPVSSFGVIGPEQLWVLDGSGLFLSTDDGATFHTITPPLDGNPIVRIHGVSFVSAADGWVLVNTCEQTCLAVDRTVDGGATWTTVALPQVAPQGIGPTTMTFVNQLDGWIVIPAFGSTGYRNVLLATSDGGLSWSIENEQSPVADLEFTGPETGWGLTGLQGDNALYRSVDGGRSWIVVALPVPAGTDTGSGTDGARLSVGLPTFFGSTGIVVVQASGNRTSHPWIAVTHDAGETWHLEQAPFSVPPCTSSGGCPAALPFAVVSPTEWFYWSGVDFYSTDDAGLHWTETLPNIAFSDATGTPISVSPGSSVGSYGLPSPPIEFLSVSTGWAAADVDGASLILGTEDGGRSFTALGSPGGPDTPSLPGLPGIAQPGSTVPG